MSKKPQISNEELFNKLAKDTGVSAEIIKKDFDALVLEVKTDENFTGLETKDVEQIARNKLIKRKRAELNSPAITWEGVVLGKWDLVDGVAKARLYSVEAYKADPVKAQNPKGFMFQGKLVAVKVGKLVDGKIEEGDEPIPIYPETEANNKWKRSGQPMPDHSWMRTIRGIAAPVDKLTGKVGEAKKFVMTLNDKLALNAKDIPYNKPIRFKGTDKTTPENAKDGYTIGTSSFTSFDLAPDLKLPPVETLIETVCGDKYVELGQVEEEHLRTAEDWNRWIITEGTVSILNPEPNKNNSLFMTLDDESLLFSSSANGGKPIPCYIPNDRGIVIDFAQESRIFVIGRTGQSKKRDEFGNITDEPGDVNINVFGIYCPEMFKVSPVESVSEDALSSVPAEADVGSDQEKSEW